MDECDFVYKDEYFPKLPGLSDKKIENLQNIFNNQPNAGDGENMHDTDTIDYNHCSSVVSQEKRERPKVGEMGHKDDDPKSCQDTQVLNDYIKNRYEKTGKKPLFKPQFTIEISDLYKHKQKKASNEVKVQKKKVRKGWGGISQFTNCEDLYEMTNNQMKVCNYFVHDANESVETDEETVAEVNVQAVRKRKRKKAKERKEGLGWGSPEPEVYVKVSMDNETPVGLIENLPVKKEIWGFARVGVDEEKVHSEERLFRGETFPVLWDTGNLSKSLVSVGFIKKLSKQWGVKIGLEKYDVPVKGVGGARLQLLGQVKKPLSLYIPGFERKFHFRPIVSTGRMSHINISLEEMKQHEVSIHLLKRGTFLEDVHTRQKTKLFDREHLYDQSVYQLELEQISNLINRLRGQSDSEASQRDLEDLSKLEKAGRKGILGGQVMAEENGKVTFYESINRVWEKDTEQIESGGADENIFKYPGNLRKDTLLASQMYNGDRVQTLRPNATIEVRPNTHAYIPCKAKVAFGGNYYVHPSADTIVQAGGILVTPSLNEMRDPKGNAYVSILNLTNESYLLKKTDTIGFLELVEKGDEWLWEPGKEGVMDKEVNSVSNINHPPDVGKKGETDYMYNKCNPPDVNHPPGVGKRGETDCMYSKCNPPENEVAWQSRFGRENPRVSIFGDPIGKLGSKKRREEGHLFNDKIGSGRGTLSRDVKSHPPEKAGETKRRVDRIWESGPECGPQKLESKLMTGINSEESKDFLVDTLYINPESSISVRSGGDKRHECTEVNHNLQCNENHNLQCIDENPVQSKDENYKQTGFVLLSEEGKVEDYVGDNRVEKKRKFWSKGGDVDYNIYDKIQHKDRLCKELYNKTHDTMREDLNESKMGDQINDQKMDKRHGLKTYSKQKKIDVKNILESEEKKVRMGEKGIFVRGRIFEDKTTFTADRDKQIIEEEERKEKEKKYLRELDETDLREFLETETRLKSNRYLKTRPLLKEMLTKLMMTHFQAFTPSPAHPLYRYEAGFCKQLIYHPEIKEKFKEKIFSTKIQTFSPDDEKELGRILRAWVRAGILRKQDISDPQTRSPHNHRIILVRKKPTTEQPETNKDTRDTGGATLAGAHKPKRLVLDLRELNSCSITHKHHMASVHEHLSMLEKGLLYNSIDLDNFFSSIPCSELASKLLSFHCSHGSFSYLRLCQGWSSAPGVASALGARLTSILDKDCLALFVDDGLQIGRFRWIDGEKLKKMGKFGDIEKVLREDVDQWDKGQGPWEGATRDRLNTKRQRKTQVSTDRNGTNAAGDKGEWEKQMKGEFSPLDNNFSDEGREEREQVWISPGIDLVIKFGDLLEAIKKFNLKLSGAKLDLLTETTDYLGFRISGEGIKMQPKYLETLAKYKVPKNSKILRNFLGFCQYFSSQAPALHRYTARLYEAANRPTGSNQQWKLSEEEIRDFHKAKLCFLRSEGLGFPDFSDLDRSPLRLWNDFSTISIASILTQVQKDKSGNYRDVLLGVFGRKCPKPLQSASSAVGECHALCFGLMKYKSLLQLAPFDLFSDHLNLNFLNSWQNLRGIYFRLYQIITQFVFRMYTISSAEMLSCDLMSRIDNQEMTEDELKALGVGQTEMEVYEEDDIDMKRHWADQKQQFLLWAAKSENQGNEEMSPSHEEPNFVGEMAGGQWVGGGIKFDQWLGGKSNWGKSECTTSTPVQISSTPAQTHPDPAQVSLSLDNCRRNGTDVPEIVSFVCSEFKRRRNCKHIKLKFPLSKPEDKIFEFSCLYFRHRSQVIAEIGPENINLFRNISRQEIIEEQKKDRDIQKAIYFVNQGWPSLENMKQLYPTKQLMDLFFKREKLSLTIDGLLIMGRETQEYALEERTVIPGSLLYHIFCLAHLSTKSFHNSVFNTYLAITFRYFVPQINLVLRYFLSRCVICLQTVHKPNRVKRMPLNVPNWVKSEAKFNDKIYLDLSGCLVKSKINQFRYFLLIIDRFSLFIEVVPLRTVETEEVKMAFLGSWISRYGPSTISISDVGSQFTGRPFRKMLSELNLIHKYSNTSLPRSEFAELGIFRIKKILKASLSSLDDHSNWPEALMLAKFSHNIRVCQSTLVAPAEIALGELPKLDLWWVTQPGPRVVAGIDQSDHHQIPVMEREKDKKEVGKEALWKNGQVRFPIKPIFLGNKMNLDLTRLRRNDPVRLMLGSQTEKEMDNFVSSPLCRHFLRAGLASMIAENQLLVYARSRPSLDKARNALFPLSKDDLGRLVFRFNPVPRTIKQAAGRLSAAWQGPFVISHVQNEILCVVEGILKGKHVAYRSPIDQIRPFYNIDMNNIPACTGDEEERETGEEKRKEGEKEEAEEEEKEEGEREDGDEEEEEEGDNVLHLEEGRKDLQVVYPIWEKGKVPRVGTIYWKTEDLERPINDTCIELMTLPESDLLCIDPVAELNKVGDNRSYDRIKESLETGLEEDGGLMFHRIMNLDYECRTRLEKDHMNKLLEEERNDMMTEGLQRQEDSEGGREEALGGKLLIYGKGSEGEEEEEEETLGKKDRGRNDTWLTEDEEEGEDRREREGEKEEVEEGEKEKGEGEDGDEEEEEKEGELEEESEGRDDIRYEEEEIRNEEEEFVSAEEGEDKEEEDGDLSRAVGGAKRKRIKEVWTTDAREREREDEKETGAKEKPVKIVALAKTMKKRLADHLGEGAYWKLTSENRRRKRDT